MQMKISYGQLGILLLLGRIFTLMTYVPLSSGGHGILPAAIAISTAIQVALLLPLMVLNRRFEGKNLVQIAAERRPLLGRLVAIIFLIFLLAMGADSCAHFGGFLSGVFFPQSNKLIFAVIFVAVCMYCASRGLQGLARAGLPIFVLFLGMLVLVGAMSLSSGALHTALPTQDATRLFPAILEDFGRSGELCVAALLMGKIPKNGLKRSLFVYFSGKIIILEVITVLIITVLGNYASIVDFPLFSLGSYAGLGGVQRLDAVYLVIWTLIAVVRIALTIALATELLGDIFPKFKCKSAAVGSGILLAGIPLIYGKVLPEVVFAAGIFALIFIIPLLLIFRRKRHAKTE